jgi:hypothetical protein
VPLQATIWQGVALSDGAGARCLLSPRMGASSGATRILSSAL